MKILVTCLPDLKRIAVQRPHHLISHLAHNHEVSVLCMKAWWLKENADDYLRQIIKDINISYVSDLRIPAIGQELLSTIGRSPTLSKPYLSKFNAHIDFHSLCSGYVRTIKMNTLGSPTIFDLCDDLIEWIQLSPQVPQAFKPAGRMVAKLLLDKIVGKSSRITYTSKSLLNPHWMERGTKFTLIPNGVNDSMFIPMLDKSLRAELGIKETDFIIGFVGALEGWVNFEPVFIATRELQKQFQNLKVLIVGSGSTLEHNKILAQKYLIDGTALFMGYVQYSLIPQYISCMDICVLPFTEGLVSQGALPLKLFEYLSCEKSVISTPLSAIKEAVSDKILYAAEPEGYRQEILHLMDNPGLRERMGSQGRLLVQKHFSWHRICDDFEQVVVEEVARSNH